MARCVPTSVFQRVRHFASDRSACDKQSLHSGQQGGGEGKAKWENAKKNDKGGNTTEVLLFKPTYLGRI